MLKILDCFKTQNKRQFHNSYLKLVGINLWNNELSTDIKHKLETYWASQLHTPPFDRNDLARDKYYVLSMFPYPSGHLHMGHVRVYTISDVIARFQRMNNKNVIHPIGWDAFGLPAENAAIERNVPPEDWTKKNISQMKSQLQQLGCSFEWHRELATCDPEYYQWTQDLFIKLYEAGLAYQKEALVNWDPVDETVLADEQVDESGNSWRSGAKVERKPLKQWFIRTTRFAKYLFEGLDDPLLQDWRDIIKIQKHWIGECNGVAFDFPLKNQNSFITVWTATPEYIEHAKFVAISCDNILSALESQPINSHTKKLVTEAQNPLTGESLPIFVTDQIEFLESTDLCLGIPGISDRDKQFCEILNIPHKPLQTLDYNEKQLLQRRICETAQKMGRGGFWTSAKLRDWLISRQRYWGTPIPIIHCKNCGSVPVPSEDLPVKLPKLTNKLLSNRKKSMLSECLDWYYTTCPKCQRSAVRETDTMDTFVDSSWYYLRYLDPDNSKEMFDKVKTKSMMPVDLYIGGKEHATLHLYYARFISYFLHSLGLLPEKEPFKRLLVQGMVMGRSYRLKNTGQYLSSSEVVVLDTKRNKAVHQTTKHPVVMSWEKMSKSKHNGVDPNDMFKEYGVDTTRLLILADVAPTSHRNWNDNTFPGILNWQRRLWLTLQQFIKYRKCVPAPITQEEFEKYDDYMFDSRNYYVKGITFNYCSSQQLSVAISKMQGLTNSLRRMPSVIFANSLQFERALACQLIVLAPMAPHFASELWSGFVSVPNRLTNANEIQWNKSVLEQNWPDVDYNYKLDLVCQINGVELDDCIIKMPRYEIEELNKDKAFELMMKKEQVQEAVMNKSIINYSYTLYKGYEGVVNIIAKSSKQTVTV